jgi:cytoplasmic tRNA 2-thiolation protein 1
MGNCTRCWTNASYYTRRYSGESLCSSCFQATMVEKVRRTISRYRMLRRGEKVGVAVSGGKDSLSLLKVLHELSGAGKGKEGRGEEGRRMRRSVALPKQHPDGRGRGPAEGGGRFELVALTVDEGVRGYRDEAIDHARALCESLGIRLVLVSYSELFGFSLDQALDWKDKRELSSCSVCGVFRRRAIDEAAQKAGVTVVATAHNLDDFVQTFMMNLLHGDVERLAWLDPSSVDDDFPVRRVKPFVEVYEEEVALYAYLSGIPFQSVSCPYMHEGLRSEVRDYLNELEAKHPGMKNVLLSSALQVTSKLARDGEGEKGGEEKKALKGAAEGDDSSSGSNNKEEDRRISFAPHMKTTVSCTRCGKPSSSSVCSVCRMTEIVWQHSKYTGR